MSEVSTLRLYLLRAMYLLIAVGLGILIWPGILVPGDNVSHMGSVVRSMLGALALVALLGLRYPIKMLPMLLFEFIWKVIWVVAFALSPWLTGELDAARQQTLFDCLLGIVLVPIVVPWGYVYRHYVKAPGDRWRNSTSDAQQVIARDAASPHP
ncbi:MAG TPA: hypothetical protein VMQ83_00130 [Gammaproteobacteria bacterium]|nr:hypothetical protein [Gammaproteobacteria bacterium]